MKNNKTILLATFAIASAISLLSSPSLAAMQKNPADDYLQNLQERLDRCRKEREAQANKLERFCDSSQNTIGISACKAFADKFAEFSWESGCSTLEKVIKTCEKIKQEYASKYE